MKKLVSLISALTMCAVMAAPIASSAAGETSENNQKLETKKSAGVTVEYTSPEYFIINIPASVTANSPIKVSASNVHIEKGATMTVTTKTESGTLIYDSTDGTGVGESLNYTITTEGDGVIVDDEGNSKSASFSVNVTDEAVYAGTYSNTVSFEIAVTDGIQSGGEGA